MTKRPLLSESPLESLHGDCDAEGNAPTTLSDRISHALRGVLHGQVTIVIHDGRVVQIDRLIRVRQFRSRRSHSA